MIHWLLRSLLKIKRTLEPSYHQKKIKWSAERTQRTTLCKEQTLGRLLRTHEVEPEPDRRSCVLSGLAGTTDQTSAPEVRIPRGASITPACAVSQLLRLAGVAGENTQPYVYGTRRSLFSSRILVARGWEDSSIVVLEQAL